MADQVPPVVDEPRASLFSNLVAIVGLIILIVVVIWGLIHLVGLSQGWFSNFFTGGEPKITINAPKTVNSGEDFLLSWKFAAKEKGNYAFVYQCKSGLSVKNGTIAIPCGNAYTVGSTNSLTLTPFLDAKVASTTMPISIAFLPSATTSKLVQGSASIAIVHKVVQSTTTTQTTQTSTQTNSSQTSSSNTNTSGNGATKGTNTDTTYTPPSPAVNTAPANLRVQILAVGVIDQYSGMFVNRAPQSPGEIAAAVFDIENTGGRTTGTYHFSANLPTLGGYIYNSPAQMPLGPGDHVVNTLRWTYSQPVGTFTVSVVGDSNDADNYAAATIGTNYSVQQPQPYYYQQQPQYYQQNYPTYQPYQYTY